MEIVFGALAPQLKDQLKDTKIPENALNLFQADADAITRLLIRGLISDSQGLSARKKLLKRLGETNKLIQKDWLWRK